MKYLMGVSFIAIILIFFVANRQVDSKSDFTNIKIQVKGLSTGQAYLVDVYKNTKNTIDSAIIDAEGKFLFQNKQNLEQGAYTILLPDSASFKVLLSKDQDFSVTTNIKDLIGSMDVEESLENDLLYKDLRFQLRQQAEWQAIEPENQDPSVLQQKNDELVEARKKHLNHLFKKYPNTLFTKMAKVEETMLFLPGESAEDGSEDKLHFFRTHFWDEVDFNDPRLLRTEAIYNHLLTYLHQLTTPQTDSIRSSVDDLMEKVLGHPPYFEFFAGWITTEYKPAHSALNDPEALYIYMVNEYLTEERAFWLDSMQIYAKQLRAKDRAHGLVGSQANDIAGEDPRGKTRSLLELKAPYVALYLYSPECDHCQEETPHFVKFYEDNKHNGFEVFAISMGAEDDVWKAFIDDNDMNWTNVKATEETDIYNKYYFEGVPTIYLLNPERTIIGKNLSLQHIVPVIQMDIRQREVTAVSN